MSALWSRAKKVIGRSAGAFGEHLLGGDPQSSSHADARFDAIVDLIDRALSVHIVHSNVSKAVDDLFFGLVGHTDAAGVKHLSFDEVAGFGAQVAEKLGLPEWIFEEVRVDAELFDLNGDWMLDIDETKRLFKKILQKQRLKLGGPKPFIVPAMSLEEAGYNVVKELGRGGQGAMYLCTKKTWFSCAAGPRYCIKFYSKEDANAGGLSELMDEYKLMISLSDSHIAKTYDVFQDDKFFYLVNEPYFGGDLTKLGKKAFDEGVRMSEDWWRGIFKQCLEGLRYLHGAGTMHCDIKEPNIMVAGGDSYKKPRVVLIDFGLASSFNSDRNGVCGTPGYIPPETWKCGMWYPRGDTFSMGIVFFQLMTSRVPSATGSILGVLQGAPNGDYAAAAFNTPLPWQEFPNTMPQLADLINIMTDRNRSTRPTSDQAVNHPWFSSSADADMPSQTVHGLVGTAAAHGAHEQLAAQLTKGNTLADLHTMAQTFQQADPTGRGVVDARVAAQVLTQHGVDPNVVKSCTAVRGGTFNYAKVAHSAIKTKQDYGQQFIRDLFNKIDTDQSGTLSYEELSKLLRSQAFDCPESHIKELLTWMDADGDGVISFEEFANAAMEYGRIAQRSDVGDTALTALSDVRAMSMVDALPGDLPRSRAMPNSEVLHLDTAWPQESLPPPQESHDIGDGFQNQFDHGQQDQGGHHPKHRSHHKRRHKHHSQHDGPGHREHDGPRERCRLLVAVVAARGLMEADLQATCVPYVTCGVSSAKSAAFQSHPPGSTRNPAWNLEREVECFTGDSVDFAVFNAAAASPDGVDGLIGTSSLAFDRFYPFGFDSEVTIMGLVTGIQGMLHIRVLPLDTGCANALHDPAAVMSPPGPCAEPSVTWGRSWTEQRPPVVYSCSTGLQEQRPPVVYSCSTGLQAPSVSVAASPLAGHRVLHSQGAVSGFSSGLGGLQSMTLVRG